MYVHLNMHEVKQYLPLDSRLAVSTIHVGRWHLNCSS